MSNRQPINKAGAVIPLLLQFDHPSADLHEALDEQLWEGLASATVENKTVHRMDHAIQARLVEMGLLFEGGRPTAAGYALLLRWQREFRRRRCASRWSWWVALTRHEMRMRDMWGC